jgi:hypothetical protein
MKVKLSSQVYYSLLEGYPQLKPIIEEYAETEITVIRSSYDGSEVGLNFHIKTEKLPNFLSTIYDNIQTNRYNTDLVISYVGGLSIDLVIHDGQFEYIST